jgi:hypothetical protein
MDLDSEIQTRINKFYSTWQFSQENFNFKMRVS